MSSGDGHSISNQPSFADRPWVPVLIPLAVVAGIGLLAVGLTILRRRIYSDRALYLNQQGRQALERDLEERITRGYRRPAGPGPGAGDAWSHPVGYYSSSRRARTANRWAWANNLAVSRREEGLNELGEAPPPYAGRSGSAHKDEAAIEMGIVRSSGEEDAERASRSAEPTTETDMTPAVSTATAAAAPGSPPPLGLPPAYSQATTGLGRREAAAAPITVPAPTVQPSERRISHLYG